MINAVFIKSEKGFGGYEISGHSDYSEQGSDIVCAIVSSAAYLCANLITDAFDIKADIALDDGYMKVTADADRLIEGLYRHLLQAQEQYEDYINVKISEV
jgi:uncharacterized protein YsxB (DUF464 family)